MGVAGSNGSLKATNGHVNGNAKHASPKPRPATKRSRGFFSWIFATITRQVEFFYYFSFILVAASSAHMSSC